MEQSDYNIISYNSCSDLGKRINYSSLIVGLAMIAFALWLLFFLNVDNPKSNMNIFRLVAGWILASIGYICLLLVIYEKHPMNIRRQNSVLCDVCWQVMPALKKSIFPIVVTSVLTACIPTMESLLPSKPSNIPHSAIRF